MGDDTLDTLRDRLDGLGEIEIDERPGLFEDVHAALVDELAALDEV